MVWLAAALAGLLFGFVLVYGSVMQSRLKAGSVDREPPTDA